MTITRPKQKVTSEKGAAAFISGAPDSSSAPTKGVKKGNKQQISLTITPALLAKVDELTGVEEGTPPEPASSDDEEAAM